MKLYDLIKQLLEQYEPLRNDDSKLLWSVWNKMGLVKNGAITKENFYSAPSSETITRHRRKIQEKYEHLQANEVVKSLRDKKAKSKGKQLYQEKVVVPFAQHMRFEGNKAVPCSCQVGSNHSSNL